MINKKFLKYVEKNHKGNITFEENENSIILSGGLTSYDEIIKVCQLASTRYSKQHVVNNITLLNSVPIKTKEPKIVDLTLDKKEVDVLVIGGGISGASIFRELTRNKIKVLLVDKEYDLSYHASSRNDGEVHPGIDLLTDCLKKEYLHKAHKIYKETCRDLDVPFEYCGQIVGIKQKFLTPLVKHTVKKMRKKGVEETYFLSKSQLKELEPNLINDFNCAIYSPKAGIVCPYGLTYAFAENGVNNGGEISLNTMVKGIVTKDKKILSVKTNRGEIFPKVVINASGVFAEDLAKMANDWYFSIHPRRGTNAIFDKKSTFRIKGIASFFDLKSNKNTKGGGMLKTVDGNILIGPDAVETREKENFETRSESIDKIFNKQKETSGDLNKSEIITYFTGVRAPTFEEDFIVEKGRNIENIIHVAGIQSPGITTAPAIACDVEKMAVEILNKEQKVELNENFNPKRQGVVDLKKLDFKKRNELIQENPDYGEIVCRCEEISKGEILDCLKSSISIPSVDSIKKRLRPGMGRCQGSFCSPLIVKIIADYFKIDVLDVKKGSLDSHILYSKTKEVDDE